MKTHYFIITENKDTITEVMENENMEVIECKDASKTEMMQVLHQAQEIRVTQSTENDWYVWVQ